MVEKKAILISFGAHHFREIVNPLLERLISNYTVVLIVEDYAVPFGLIEEIKEKESQGIVEKLFFVPGGNNVIKKYLYLIRETEKLRSYDFDLWLTGSDMHVLDRFIKDILLPEKCASVVLWHGITYLLDRVDIAKKLVPVREYFGENIAGSGDHHILESRSWLEKIREHGGLVESLRLIPVELPKRTRRFFYVYRIRIRLFFERIVLPLLLIRKTFRLRKFDQLTQLGSGYVDAILFTDRMEVDIHQRLYRKKEIYEIEYPTAGRCRCSGGGSTRTLILSPLSGIIDVDNVPTNFLELYLRDFRIVFSETNVKGVHLRRHPRDRGKWCNQLCDYLNKNGIAAEVVEPDLPIWKLICNYEGIAGFASMALRDARASCDFSFVVGFYGVTRSRYKDPKIIYGNGEGISWIEEDGTYNPSIFRREKYSRPWKKPINEALSDVLRNRSTRMIA